MTYSEVPAEREVDIRHRLANITPGDWRWGKAGGDQVLLSGGDEAPVLEASWENGMHVLVDPGDAEFIANSPADVKYLLAVINTCRQEIRHWRNEYERVDIELQRLRDKFHITG